MAAVVADGLEVTADGAQVHAGWESVVLETRDGWMYRFPRPHVDFDRELSVLARLRGRLPVPIPTVERVGRSTRFAAYRKLEGYAFDAHAYQAASDRQRTELTDSLAVFLAAMHDSLTDAEVVDLALPTANGPSASIATIEARLPTFPSVAAESIRPLLREARIARRRS